jgi:hypothetical protein
MEKIIGRAVLLHNDNHMGNLRGENERWLPGFILR